MKIVCVFLRQWDPRDRVIGGGPWVWVRPPSIRRGSYRCDPMDPPIVWEVSGSVDVNGGVAWLSPGACGLTSFAWIVRGDDHGVDGVDGVFHVFAVRGEACRPVLPWNDVNEVYAVGEERALAVGSAWEVVGGAAVLIRRTRP